MSESLGNTVVDCVAANAGLIINDAQITNTKDIDSKEDNNYSFKEDVNSTLSKDVDCSFASDLKSL